MSKYIVPEDELETYLAKVELMARGLRAKIEKVSRWADSQPNPWDDDDIRSRLLGSCMNISTTLLINLRLLRSVIFNNNWWANFAPEYQSKHWNLIRNWQVTHLRNSTYIIFFSLIESQFRQLLPYVVPVKGNQKTKSFYTVYTTLFKELKLSSDSIELFDLARLTRNSIHNNMHHVNENGTTSSRKFIFGGKQFVFEHEKKIPRVHERFFIDVMEAMFDVVTAVIKHQNVQTLTSPILGIYQSTK